MKFEPIQIVPPSALPLTLIEAKAHCRVDGTDNDDYLTAAIGAAVSYLDGYSGILGKCLMPQTWAQEFDRWKDFPLCLGPVIDLLSISYFDSNGDPQSVDLSTVRIERRVIDTFAALKSVASWPNADFSYGPITVTWRAGHSDAGAVPDAIKQAMKLLVGHWFESREAVVVGTISSELPLAVDALLTPHRRVKP
ncbi:head-tail connector protein [Cohaesibacter celericrescens]|uniref:Phage gp6-like head-tail connector protein n=1 Tax=Cohaesibacter celericrescens TaxID=2067669 RepID=A0A2N5XQW1_9HYPH|nr:head-tail connector protein [Cohaesibacter celericrescens]PLW76808.1 hypothetical protein C0081_12155 [Cohaesibacter celericrescens]